MKGLAALLLTMLAFAWAPAAPAAQRSAFPSVAAWLDEQGRAGFSGAVLVARNGRVLERAYGQADREWNIPNTVTTRFRIGSLTKQFTATAIMLLAQDGRLSLDDPICRFLDSCPEAWRPIRIAQLLNHSSGIPDFVRLPGMRERFTLPARLEDTIALVAARPLDFAPGTDARYGNSGFLISALIIARVSGLSYERFLQDRIYAPLGMAGSGYAHDEPLLPGRAHGYVRTRVGSIENAPYIDMSIPIGAGSQYSTVEDLYRWDRALAGDGLLSAAARARMFAAGTGGFGYGWEVAEEQGRRVIEHNGDINGFGAFIARYPDQDAVIVILTNVEGTRVREMKDQIAARLFARD